MAKHRRKAKQQQVIKADDGGVPSSGTAFPESWLTGLLGGGPTVSGIPVSPDRAMANPAVLRCVLTLSEDVASLSLALYQGRERGGNSRKEIEDHPALNVVSVEPNDWQTPYDYWRFQMMNYLLDGNSYAYIDRNQRGEAMQLIPIPAQRVTLWSATDGELFYGVARSSTHEYAELAGAPLMIPMQYVLHDRGPSRDGIHGLSPIAWARESIGLAIAGEDHASRTFSAGARPSGVLEYPKALKDDVKKRLKAEFEEYRGQQGALKTILLQDGMKFNPITMSNADVQFIESRRFQTEEIARLYDIPHPKVGIADPGRNVITDIQQYYANTTLLRHLERIESLLNTRLLTSVERKQYFFEFDLSSLTRADMKTRYEGYAIGRQWGWENSNTILAQEHRNPLGKDGDVYLQPANMVPLGTEPTKPAPAPGTTAPGTQPPGATSGPEPNKPTDQTDGSTGGAPGNTGGKSNGHLNGNGHLHEPWP